VPANDPEARRLARERSQDIASRDSQREQDIAIAAEARGRTAAKLEARLDGMDSRIDRHGQRLDTINGSVRETGKSLEALRADTGEKLDHLSDQVEAILNEQKTRDKVNEALIHAAETAATRGDAGAEKKLRLWQKISLAFGGLVGGATFVLLLVQVLNGTGHA
jgi:chromosome segregation ATPase